MEYYTTFFDERLDNANEPFIIEWRSRQWLVDFDEPQYGVEVHTSNLFTPDGITLNLRRVQDMAFNADGSIDSTPPTEPTGASITDVGQDSVTITFTPGTD